MSGFLYVDICFEGSLLNHPYSGIGIRGSALKRNIRETLVCLYMIRSGIELTRASPGNIHPIACCSAHAPSKRRSIFSFHQQRRDLLQKDTEQD